MRRRNWFPLLPVLGVFLILSVIYARATPVLEASDELWHFGMVDYIADNARLPVQDPDVETTYRQEGSQPPLYYLIGAALVSGINRDDLETRLDYNPHARVGVPGSVGNKNILLDPQPASLEGDAGTAYAVTILRGFGILLACVTITAIYGTALQISGPSYATLAAALAAFNPMFIFISASVNNDNLVTALCSRVLWQVVAMGWHGFKLWRSVFIAVGIALAALSKLSGLVLVPVTLFAAGYVAYQRNDQRGFNILFGLTAGAGLLIAGWWYLRNILLYGELFGTEMMVRVAGPRLAPFTPITLFQEAWGFFISYWALFGGVNIPTWEWYYSLALGIAVISAVGLALAVRKSLPYILRDMNEYGRLFAVTDLLNMYWLYAAAVFAASAILALIGIITWTAQTYASQGRLLFPYIAAISLLGASGLLYFVRHQHKWTLTIGLGSVLGITAFAMPFTHITPAYEPPPTVAELPEDATPVYARYGDIELLGYELPDERYFPGDMIPVTVYWRAGEQAERDLSAFLTAVDSDGEPLGKVDTYPGAGLLRTSTWEPNVIYADTYGIPLTAPQPNPERQPGTQLPRRTDMRLQVGWWHYPTRDVIPPVDEDNDTLEAVLLDAGGYIGEFFTEGNYRRVPRGLAFDERIRLVGRQVNNLPTLLRLAWRADQRVEDDYTVFVQVFDNRTGELVGQGDAPPDLSTSYWRRGDLNLTEHRIVYNRTLTPGSYTVLAGWYDPDDLTRLDLRRDEDDAVEILQFSFP